MPTSGILCGVALIRTDVSEELIAFVIRVIKISELGTKLAVINKCQWGLRVYSRTVHVGFVVNNVSLRQLPFLGLRFPLASYRFTIVTYSPMIRMIGAFVGLSTKGQDLTVVRNKNVNCRM
jgi:hypothetical protein